MRLLKFDDQNHLTLTGDLVDGIPPYAILSHTWGRGVDEVTFADLQDGVGHNKPGYAKIQFCGCQAKKDRIDYFWVDTCCIDKSNNTELSEAIVSMFRWYRDAERCYVYLSDVSSVASSSTNDTRRVDRSALRNSRWFRRGWTLQELLAPKTVEFFSQQGNLIGTKATLLQSIHEITGIAVAALQGAPLSHYSVDERMRWAASRQTKRAEDKAYCLLGIFDIFLPLIYGEGENAFSRLREAIDKQLSVSQTSVHAYWCVSRPANSLFIGRTDILEDLEQLIRSHMARSSRDEQCRVVISGIGGQGKSEICLQLAHRLRNRFWAVLWIDVSTEADAERSYLDVARKLSIPAESWEDARHGIANLKNPWLMILDNADDLSVDYSIYFPDANPGVIILTSRNDECQCHASTGAGSISLDGLAVSDAQDLLLRSARVPQHRYREQEHEAEIVARLLQSHALALIQAGAYIFNGHCTLNEYPQMYGQRRRRLLGFRPKQAKSRYGDVYTTFEVSADILKDSKDEAAQDALQLLPMLAVCGPTRFPLFLFEVAWQAVQRSNVKLNAAAEDDQVYQSTLWYKAQIPAYVNITDTQWDSFRLNEAVRMLRTLSLITVDSENGENFVSMHALVHAWACDRQSSHELHRSWLRMGCVMAFALAKDLLSQQQERQLQSHCEVMTSWDMKHIYGNSPATLVTRILVRYGWYLTSAGANGCVLKLVQRTLQHLHLDPTWVDEKWIDLYRLTARSFEESGRIAESVALQERLLHVQAPLFASDQLNELRSQHELAVVYEADGQREKAISLLEHVVEVRKRVLAEDHPDRLASQHELAAIYRLAGQVGQSVALLEHVVEVSKRTLAKDHPDTLASELELAGAYASNMQMSQAVTLLERVVEVSKQTLAEQHPLRLNSRYTLAVWYWELGRHRPAYEMLTNVVAIQKHSLAASHPDQLNCEEWLSYMQKTMAKIEATVPRRSI